MKEAILKPLQVFQQHHQNKKNNKQTKKNVKCFSYSAFMALKHSTFASFLASTTSEFEYLLKRVLKITKQDQRRSVNITSHNKFWVKIQGRVKRVRRKPENFWKKYKNKTCKGEKVVASSKHCIWQQKLYCIVNMQLFPTVSQTRVKQLCY